MNDSAWFQLLLTVVAACQITETARHASILEPLRAKFEAKSEFWAELIGCGFCFSHWAAASAVLILLGHRILFSLGYENNPCLIILLWLTVIRGANLLNDFTKQRSRTPAGDVIELDDMTPIDVKETTGAGKYE